MDDLLKNLSKEDLIKIIGNMHDLIRVKDGEQGDWFGYGSSIEDVNTLNEVGAACSEYCACNGWELPKVK